jgi:hypothetical protein
MNLVSLALNFITPTILSRVASALGVDSRIAQMAISAALPTILGAIVGKASKPEGLNQLTSMLGQQDPGLLTNFASMVGGSDQSKLVSTGASLLGGLMGNSSAGALTGALARFSGMGETPAKSLLGMMAPVALGTIAQQQKASGLDAGGLASMLMGQKDNIAKAMPAGFGELLKGTGILDAIPSAPAAATVESAPPPRREEPRPAPERMPDGPAPGALPGWLKWGTALGAILFAFYLLGPGAQRQVTTPPVRVVHNNVDVGDQVSRFYSGLRDTLGTVKDANSAQAALGNLQTANRQLETFGSLATSMTPQTRSDFARLIASYLPQMRGLIDTALAAAGVSPVLKPVLDQMLSRIEALAKT